MEIKLLPKSLRETLRSEVNIRSFPKGIAQLVINSIDANSASIAVRVNLVSCKIQVIDNGSGISKHNLKLIGLRYATSKYYSIEELEKNPNILPNRGESLASIIKLSKNVKITTQCHGSLKTYSKVFETGKSYIVSSVKQRPSKGTTIIIDNLMYNLPVRKKSINQFTCLEEIKREIECIALIHPNTSFSLRNDSTGEIIFHTYRTKFVFQTATNLYGKEFSKQLRKICYNEKNFSVSGLISINSHAQSKYQFVYINKRFIPKTKIYTLINALISKSKIIKNKDMKTESPMVKQKHAAFIINIKCPYSELDIVDYIEPEIEFKNWETILTCVEAAVLQFLRDQNLIESKETNKNDLQNGSPLKESTPNVRTSQIGGVIRGIPMKRILPDSDKIEQSLSSEPSIIFDNLCSSPKKICTETSPDKLSVIQKPENTETINDQHSIMLESNSENGKYIIMDMFLKSTRVYRNDDDLLTFKSTEKYSNKSSLTLKNNFNKTNVTTSSKISITKAVTHNINFNNDIENDNNNTSVFKVPDVPKFKLLKRKSSASNDSIDVSAILAKDKITVNKNKQQISNNTALPLDFIKNISERNNFPPDITNHFTKLFDNFIKEPKRNNYDCTIKITKRLKCMQSSDFLHPATNLPKNKPTKQFRCRNQTVLQKKSRKEIVHANQMLKTFYLNNHQTSINKYKTHNSAAPPNNNYVSNLKTKNNNEPLSSTYKHDMCLPIYNIKHNYYQTNKYNNKQKYNDPRNKIIERLKSQGNHLNFASPHLSFKPYSTNPYLNNLLSKNSFSMVKPSFYLNNNYSSPCEHESNNRDEFNSEIYPTFESHQFTKDYRKIKQNIKSKLNYLNDTAATKTYVDLTNKQNKLQIFASKISNNKSETELTKKSNTCIPETPINLLDNIDGNNENLDCKNSFLSNLQISNGSKSKNNIYCDSSNISNWIDISKENNQNPIDQEYSLPIESQRNSIINNAKNTDNIDKNKSIKKTETIIYENLNTSNLMTPEIVSNNISEDIENMNQKKKLSLISSNYSSPIISSLNNRRRNVNNYNKNKPIYENLKNKSNNEQLEKDLIIDSSSMFSPSSNLIQEKDVINILNTLDQSIMNDTLKLTNSEKRNSKENDKHSVFKLLESEKESTNVSGTNSVFPVFREDSSNLILENTNNIDAILNISLSTDTNKQTNLSNIEHSNYFETHNKCSNNIQSNSNLLSKNANESNENMNQIETDNNEYVNETSEWIKQTSNFGNSYYLNVRTGMTSFGTPKDIDGCLVTKRHSFMPKGMSPIMLPTSTVVSKELSPNSKNVLHQTIANTENDELQTVKWINYLQNSDSEKFFNDLYLGSENKNYETEIPNINKYKLPKKIVAGFENYSISKDDFNNVTVLNQFDNKFILAKIEIQQKYDLLVLFDQHAVHERILLETLLKDYEEKENKLKSVKCKTIIRLTLDDFEIRMLHNYKKNFEDWGFQYEIEDKQNVTFSQIPLCWQTKDDSNLKHKEYSIIDALIMTLIQEESSWLRNFQQINIALPLVIQNTIKMEACRTAIKFGDPLSKEPCENLIKELLLCDLPFNCAHGRPTIVPLIDLNNINHDIEDEEINLNALKT